MIVDCQIVETPTHDIAPSRPLRDEIAWSNFWRHLQVGAIPLLSLPALSIYGLCTTGYDVNTLKLSLVAYVISTMSITAGYHRLFSHKAYTSSTILKTLLLCAAAGTGEGSCKWWVRGHRAHHRYSDTDQDPYGVHEGFFHAHFGWMIFTPRFRPGRVDISDMQKDKLVQWQHKHYLPLFVTFGFVLPLLVAGLGWQDWRGGFFFACCLRLTLAHHATFCVNSVAHYLGEATYDDDRSPRDHVLTALITNGEGYHNFHHEFPNDYRNAIRWYQWDPTKAFIYLCAQLGLAGDLNRTGDQVIHKSLVQMEQKVLDRKKALLPWPEPDLPEMSAKEFLLVSKARKLIICNGFVHDVASFCDQHPGGAALVTAHLSKDVTRQFNGQVYKHSNAANNILDMMRIARYRPDPPVPTAAEQDELLLLLLPPHHDTRRGPALISEQEVRPHTSQAA